jgi:dolichol-phosphate mannosyltransferase
MVDMAKAQPETPLPVAESGWTLSVVIPTRNEAATVPLLISHLSDALAGVSAQLIFVDDSDDGTAAVIEQCSQGNDLSIQVVHREGDARRGGLSTAAVIGIRTAAGEYVCVMDADLQHPPQLVKTLLSRAEETGADIVIASRYVPGGSDAGLSSVSRKAISRGAKWFAKIVFIDRLHSVTDPLSGFFLARRSVLTKATLRPIGFKILLDILIRSDWRVLREEPLQFASRAGGTSKATLKQGRDFLLHVMSLFWHARFDAPSRRLRRSAKSEQL